MSLSQKQVIVVGLVLVIISLLSPFFSVITISTIETSISMHTLFWWMQIKIPGSLIIRLNDYWVLVGYIPFVAFRLGLPVQFIRYYDLKATRFALALTGFAGEIPPIILIVGLPSSLYFSQIVCPLPFHLFICTIIVLLKPAKQLESPFTDYDELYVYDEDHNLDY